MVSHCLACGAPAQPEIEFCLECDVELYESFAQARDYTDDRELTEPQPYHCADRHQRDLEF